jgi:hypothetical protein
MGPLRLLKICEPGSLSHIRTKLFWIYLLRSNPERIQNFKTEVTSQPTVGRSLRPAPPGAHDHICVRWILLPVSPEAPHLTAMWVCPLLKSPSFFGCKHFLFSTLTVHILRRSRPHTRDYTLGYLALSVTTSSPIEKSRSASEDFTLQKRSNSSSEATCCSQRTSL